MDRNVDITSYVSEQSNASDQPPKLRQPSKRIAANSRQIPSISGVNRRTELQQNKNNFGMPREVVNKPMTRRSSSVANAVERRQTTFNIPTSIPKAATNRRLTTAKAPQDWSTSLRSGSSAIPPEKNIAPISPVKETSNEQFLLEELSRMRTSFESFRNECYSRMTSMLTTNASLVEDIGNLKKQLHSTNTRLIDFYSVRSPIKSGIDTKKLLAELSTKLLESSEFKESVLAVIKEHEANVAEEEEEIKSTPKSFRRANPFKPYTGFNNSPNYQSKRATTTVRDESCVISNDVDDDEVEIIEDHGKDPLALSVSKHSEIHVDASDESSPPSSGENYSDENDIAEAINRTFTISDDEPEYHFMSKENSPALFKLQSSTGSSRRYNLPKINGSFTNDFDNNVDPYINFPTRRRTGYSHR